MARARHRDVPSVWHARGKPRRDEGGEHEVLLAGDPERGRQDLAEAIALSQSIMGKIALPQFRVMMTEVLLLAGARDEARAWVREALAAGEEQEDAYFAAELHRLAAICHVNDPHDLSPAEHVRRALDVARQQGARFFELRAALTGLTITGELEPLRRALHGIVEPEPWADVTAAQHYCLHGGHRRGLVGGT